MCGTKLKLLLALLVLFSQQSCLPLLSSCYAEVVLTDEEAKQIMNDIQESRKDLQEVQKQLEDVKKDYSEQKTSYEEQLNEAEKKNSRLEKAVTVTGSSTVVLTVVMILLICL